MYPVTANSLGKQRATEAVTWTFGRDERTNSCHKYTIPVHHTKSGKIGGHCDGHERSLVTWTCWGRMLGNDVVRRLVVNSCTKAVLFGNAPAPRAATSHNGACRRGRHADESLATLATASLRVRASAQQFAVLRAADRGMLSEQTT